MSRRVLLVMAGLVLAGCASSPSPSPSASASASTASPTTSASTEPLSSASAPAPASASAAASETATATPGAASEAPPATSPSLAAAGLPDTPVTAALDQSYNTTGDPFDPDDLGGIPPGAVTARWYVADDRWVVHYDGLDPDVTGPLCPGSSAQTAAGFEHVSNAPTEAGACDGFDATLATDPVGVRRCGGEVLYLTAIPADVSGMLFASIETQYQTPGSVVGVTGMAHPTGGEAPEIDLEALDCEAVPARP